MVNFSPNEVESWLYTFADSPIKTIDDTYADRLIFLLDNLGITGNVL